MKTTIYIEGLPEDARKIREAVFIKEQGFQKEFDEVDSKAAHIVIYDDEIPMGTCRVFWNDEMDSYIIGRVAVMKEYRGRKLGTKLLQEAEKYVMKERGKKLSLHAQCRVKAFYEAQGYQAYGRPEDDEGCPHIWMEKTVYFE